MTRVELALGSVIFIAVIAAGSLSVSTVDRHFARVEVVKAEAVRAAAAKAEAAKAEAAKNIASNDKVQLPEPPAVRGACVDKDGSWKNWSWANVPMLSPKCEQ
jgi:hypothetical protein